MRDERPRPIQIGLSTLMLLTAAVAILFGTLRSLGVPPRAGAIVLAVLVVGLLAAVGLVIVIAQSSQRPHDPDDRRDPPR